MTTCIYYEQERVAAEDARRARDLAGSWVGESAPADAIWANDIPGPPPQREPHFRHLPLLDDLMPRLDCWAKALEGAAPAAAWRHEVSLAETAKYELLFALAPGVQRWQALANIRRRWNPDRLLWFTSRRWPDPELTALCRAAAPLRVEVHPAAPRGARSWKSAWCALKDVASPWIDRSGWIARTALSAPRLPRSRGDVVFTEYYPNSVSAALPLAERLESQFGVRVVWLAGRKKVADALAARGQRSLLLPEVLSAGTHFRARLNGRQRRLLRTALRSLPEDLFGESGQTGPRDYFLTVLEPRVLAAWDHAAGWVEAYHAIFAALRPRAVVSSSYSGTVGRAAALSARHFGGRAIYLQHGIFHHCQAYSSFCHDLVLMWGQNDLRNLIRFGVDPQTIRITGPTMCDELHRRRSQSKPSVLPAPGEPLKVALMASRTGGSMVSYAEAKASLVAVATAVRRLDGAHLTVKIHPGDHTGMVPEVMRDFPEFAVLQKGSAQDTIMMSDVVIVDSSTTGLEACVADKPLIVLRENDDAYSEPYRNYRAVLNVSVLGSDPATDLAQAIAGLQADPGQARALAEGRRRLLDDMLNGSTGDAAEQAATAVAELLGLCQALPTSQRSGP